MPHKTGHVIRFARIFLLAALIAPATAAAQVPTGNITGRVTDTQGRSVPGADVTATSPALQGVQTTRTTPNGDYVLGLLPPGDYTVVISGSGFAVQTATRRVAATETVDIDVVLQPAAVTETVTVSASTPVFTNSVVAATNFSQAVMEQLPTGRTLMSAVFLAPSVHETGPDNNVSIGGAMSFDNLFMVNGVQIQDNFRGTAQDLFIEDAIQETTVTTSGVTAEYGRFGGGVVNTLTKSGGNTFSGSFRTSFRNDDWRSVTPFDEPKVDELVPTYEFTFGGPVIRDRTWFFGAGRFEDAAISRQTGFTEIPYVFEQNEKRFEIKGTQAIDMGQRLQVAYTGIQRKQRGSAWPASSAVMDLRSLTNPTLPESLLAVHYTNTISSTFFVEAQYSARQFTFEQSGGLDRDRINGTPLSDNTTGAWWWAPNFCGVCGNEERDNSALLFKGTYFLSTADAGSHNVVFGYDGFNDRTRADNHQSASDWHVWTTGSIIEGETIYPVVLPGQSTYIIHWPILESSQGADFRTHALFVNDTWNYDTHWTFNLGVRFDKNAGRDASDNLVASDASFSPRLGLVWDPRGTGRTSINASFGRYVSAIASSIAGSASPAGTSSILAYFYDGDPINDGDGPYVTSDEALRRVFDWYDANQPFPFQATIPGIGVRVNDSLDSPHTDEFAVGVSHQLGSNGAVRLDFVDRTFGDFYVRRIDTTTGQAEDEFGQVFDVALLENTNELTRRYTALNAQASYRIGTDFHAGGNYTLSRLRGNTNGESSESGPLASSALSYPEYSDLAWSLPEGDLAADQRHRARLWATYALPWGRDLLDVVVGATQRIESGSPYGAATAIIVDPFVENPGYAQVDGLATYYFTDRDAFRTEGQVRTDLSINATRRFGGAAAPEIFANFQVLNLFNQAQLFNIGGGAINSTVLTAVDDPSLELFNPFTETPVEGVHWRKGNRFGEAIGAAAYTQPRLFRFSVGVRF